ncbi:hypothetical protein D3C78_1372840 [compost metagenome]
MEIREQPDQILRHYTGQYGHPHASPHRFELHGERVHADLRAVQTTGLCRTHLRQHVQRGKQGNIEYSGRGHPWKPLQITCISEDAVGEPAYGSINQRRLTQMSGTYSYVCHAADDLVKVGGDHQLHRATRVYRSETTRGFQHTRREPLTCTDQDTARQLCV